VILVDTSVWIDHLHRPEAKLVAFLERNEVAMHAMIIGELALGSLARRTEVLALLGDLRRVARATDDEVLTFIEARSLWSSGLSVVDAHVLTSLRLASGTALWTRDKRLRSAANDLGINGQDGR
jgi:hypothetical protein